MTDGTKVFLSNDYQIFITKKIENNHFILATKLFCNTLIIQLPRICICDRMVVFIRFERRECSSSLPKNYQNRAMLKHFVLIKWPQNFRSLK